MSLESYDVELELISSQYYRNIQSIYMVFHRYESSDGKLELIFGLNCRNIRSIYTVFHRYESSDA